MTVETDQLTSPPQKYALLLEYDGTAFHGWQQQVRHRTVQAVIQQALADLLAGAPVPVWGCSRTDAGVHARSLVAHFSARTTIPVDRLARALNSVLPADVCVREAVAVAPDFHARFDALSKTYRYSLWNHPVRPALGRHRVAHLPGPFHVQPLLQTLPLLVGRKDFAAFCDTGGSSRTTVRAVQSLRFRKQGPLMTLDVTGDGFLYHMVRILVGTLVAVGQEKQTPQAVSSLFENKDRRLAGKTMPAHGLCLEDVSYEPALFTSRQQLTESECEIDVHVEMD